MKKMAAISMTILFAAAGLVLQQTESEAAVKGTLSKKELTVAVGKKAKLKVTGAGKAKVTYISKKKKTATVSGTGVVKGVKKGKTEIKALIKKGNKKKSLTCKVTVIPGAKSLKVCDESGKAVKSIVVEKYGKAALSAKMAPKKCGDEVKWRSVDTDIATVKNGVVTGQYVGKTTVTAETISGKKVRIKVTVKAPELKTALKTVYADDFKIGAAVNTWQLDGIGGYAKAKALISGQFNSITMENQMKPDSLLHVDTKESKDETSVVINTEMLDKVLGAAEKNGLKLRGHTLVWHSQTPEWFFHKGYDAGKAYADKETMRNRMENYIKQVLEYCQTNYPGVVYAWDVANEVVADDGTMRTNSGWYKTYGDAEYVYDAFRFARKYASSDVSLFLNDYNEYMPVKRDKLCGILKELYDEGICDGIGMQSHYSMSYPTTALVKVALQKFNAIAPGKIQIQLTELDIHNTYDTAAGQTAVANKYGSLFRLLVDMKRNGGLNITGVTFWGLTDADTWLTSFKGESSYPLLFGGDYAAKSAYFAVLNAAGK